MSGAINGFSYGYGYGNNNMYGMNGLGYNDPYFIQAYNSPNYNYQLLQQQQQQAQIAQQTAQQQQIEPTQTSPSFQGAAKAIEQEQPEKKSKASKWVLGIASVIGLAWAGYKCFKKGDGTGLAKIFDGAKKYGSSAWNCVKGWFGKSAPKTSSPAALPAATPTTAQTAVQTVATGRLALPAASEATAQAASQITTPAVAPAATQTVTTGRLALPATSEATAQAASQVRLNTVQNILSQPQIRTVSASGFDITLCNGEMVKCVKDGVEYTRSQLPENFELLINRALKKAS